MNIIRFPRRENWREILARPQINTRSLEDSVGSIIEAVRQGGDDEVRNFTKRFDGVDIDELRVSDAEIVAASSRVPDDLKAAIDHAKKNIEKFHVAQHLDPDPIETMPGVRCWSRSVGIEKVGLYIPAGSAPLFSTVLMLGIPAKIAGCRDIVLCSPPNSNGRVDDTVLYTAALCGIKSIFKIGGAQAIAAMAYGTETIPSVYKIFGPGNSIVTCAKQLVSMEVAIDMPAGPSEVAILADDSAVPAFVAADLLSQAEHGPDSQVILVTDSEVLIEATLNEIGKQTRLLTRQRIAESSLANSKAILVSDLDEGIHLLNDYAAEHLIIATADAENIANKVTNAGSVFIGNYSCESAGDYASGTNHTLPTGGFAKAFSGVSVASFSKRITFQKLSPDGIRNIGPAVELMAAAEGLDAHKKAITVRLEVLNGV